MEKHGAMEVDPARLPYHRLIPQAVECREDNLMSTMVKLTIEPMFDEAFRPYGEIWDPKDHPPDRRQSFAVDFQPEGKPTASIMWQPYQTLTFTQPRVPFAAEAEGGIDAVDCERQIREGI